MRHLGLMVCPAWCAQPKDEHDNQAHVGHRLEYLTAAGDLIWVRPVAAWEGRVDGDGWDRTIEMDRIVSEMVDQGLSPWHMTAADAYHLGEMLTKAEMQLADWLDHGDEPLCDTIWAYPQAEADYVEMLEREAEDAEATG